MAIEVNDNGSWVNISNPQIYDDGWKNIIKGEIYSGTWQTFYTRITPVIPTVSNVSRTINSLTFNYSHPGDTETNSPVRIEYRLKNSGGTIIQSGDQTFNSGAINQNVTFSGLTRNTTYTFEARAVYPDAGLETAYASISRTTEDISVVAPQVFAVGQTTNSLTFRYTHPGDTQTSTPISITYSLINNSTFQTVSGPTTSSQTTGPIDVTLPAFTGLSSGTSYTFVAQANYVSYGLTSGASSVSNTTLVPAPTYQMLPSTTSFSRGGGVTIDVSTTNVSNGTVLYWRAIPTNTSDPYNEFTSTQGSVIIQSNSGSFNVNTNYLNVTPGSFHQTVTTTTNSFDWRARVTTIEGYRGPATFTVKLYSDVFRTNEVATTSLITITVEPYNVGVSVATVGGVNVVTYFVPSGVTTGEVNDLRTISGLSPLVQYNVTVTTRYTSRSPSQFFSAPVVTRSTFRDPSNLNAAVIFGDVVMSATSGAISNNVTGTGDCIIQFRLQRMSGSTVVENYPIINATAITSGTAVRSVGRTLPVAGTYRFQARSAYPNHGANYVGVWITSSTFTRP